MIFLDQIVLTPSIVLKSKKLGDNFIIDLPKNWAMIYRITCDMRKENYYLNIWLSYYKNSGRTKGDTFDLKERIFWSKEAGITDHELRTHFTNQLTNFVVKYGMEALKEAHNALKKDVIILPK